MFKLFGRGNEAENMAPTHHMFNISQDSMASQSQFSQFSQDFTDRFQQCNVNAAIDGIHGMTGDDSMLDGSGGGSAEGEYVLAGAAPMATRLTQLSDRDSSQQNDATIGSQPLSGPSAGPVREAPAFTSARPAALEIPPLGLFTGASLTSTGTPMSALSTGTPHSQLGGGGSVFFNSSMPPMQAPIKGQMLPPALKSTSSSSSSAHNSLGGGAGGFGGGGMGMGTAEKERLVNIAAPMDNPFLQDENAFAALQAMAPVISAHGADGSRQPSIRGRKSARRPPQSIYVGAFRERPRYICDFEQQELLGEGTHSVVYRARRRLDGRCYAIKKLKRRICGEREGALLVKEAMAGAALQGCPSMVQYYGCWLDDNHLYVQTEDCAYGTMEPFVGALLPSSEDMRVLWECQQELDRQTAERAEESQHTCGASGQSDSFSQPSQPSEFLYSVSQEEEPEPSSMDYSVDACATSAASTAATAAADMHFSDFGPASSVRIGIAEELAWLLLRDMCAALHFMHNKGIAHLDVRPANVFIARAPGAKLPGHVQAAWLLPGAAEEEPACASTTNPTVPELQEHLLQGRAVLRLGDLGQCCRLGEPLLNEGESRYLPREVLNESAGLDLAKSDMFSLGASVYELLLGRQLGAGGDTGAIEWHELRDGRFNAVVERRYSAGLLDVLRGLMHPNPTARPAAAHVYVAAAEVCSGRKSSSAEEEVGRLRMENMQLKAMLLQGQGPAA